MHDLYRAEAEERSRLDEHGIRILRPDTGEPTSPLKSLELEAAYRRGFYHGWHQALQALECFGTAHCDRDGYATPDDLKEFLVGPLYEWRYSQHHGRFQPPPGMSSSDEATH